MKELIKKNHLISVTFSCMSKIDLHKQTVYIYNFKMETEQTN